MNYSALWSKLLTTLITFAGTCSIVCIASYSNINVTGDQAWSVEEFCNRAKSFWRVSTDSTLFYASLAHDLALKEGSRTEVAFAKRHLGIAYLLEGNQDQAAALFQRSLELYNELGDQQGISAVLNNFGNLHDGKGNYEDALYYFNKSLSIRRNLQDSLELATTLNNIGLIFLHAGETTESAVWFRKAIEASVGTDNLKLLANAYDNLGLSYQMMDSLQNALHYHRDAFQISQKYAFRAILAKASLNISSIYQAYGLRDSAEHYLKNALLYLESSSYPPDLISASLAKATFAFFLQDIDNAIMYGSDALSKAESCDNHIHIVRALNLLKEIHASKGDFEQAYFFSEKYQKKLNLQREPGWLGGSASLSAIQQEFFNERLILENKAKEYALKMSRFYLIFFISLALILICVTIMLVRSKNKRDKALIELKDKNEKIRDQQIKLTNSQEKMTELLAMKDKIFSMLSHDLRGPLSDLKNMFILIEEGLISDAEREKIMERLKDDLNHSTNMLDNLLRWSSVQMKNESIKSIPIHVKSVINETTELFNSSAFSKDITIEMDLHDESILILCDLECFKFSMRNLISNAIKFTPPGGLINISSSLHDLYPDYAVIKVSDNGIGMSEEKKKSLFSNKVHSAIGTKNEKGAGLGLLLSYEMIEKNGGMLEVYSEESIGTSFSIILPKYKSNKIDMKEQQSRTDLYGNNSVVTN